MNPRRFSGFESEFERCALCRSKEAFILSLLPPIERSFEFIEFCNESLDFKTCLLALQFCKMAEIPLTEDASYETESFCRFWYSCPNSDFSLSGGSKEKLKLF